MPSVADTNYAELDFTNARLSIKALEQLKKHGCTKLDNIRITDHYDGHFDELTQEQFVALYNQGYRHFHKVNISDIDFSSLNIGELQFSNIFLAKEQAMVLLAGDCKFENIIVYEKGHEGMSKDEFELLRAAGMNSFSRIKFRGDFSKVSFNACHLEYPEFIGSDLQLSKPPEKFRIECQRTPFKGSTLNEVFFSWVYDQLVDEVVYFEDATLRFERIIKLDKGYRYPNKINQTVFLGNIELNDYAFLSLIVSGRESFAGSVPSDDFDIQRFGKSIVDDARAIMNQYGLFSEERKYSDAMLECFGSVDCIGEVVEREMRHEGNTSRNRDRFSHLRDIMRLIRVLKAYVGGKSDKFLDASPGKDKIDAVKKLIIELNKVCIIIKCCPESEWKDTKASTGERILTAVKEAETSLSIPINTKGEVKNGSIQKVFMALKSIAAVMLGIALVCMPFFSRRVKAAAKCITYGSQIIGEVKSVAEKISLHSPKISTDDNDDSFIRS